MRKSFALFLAACAALVGFADVESLEETGGYVTTEAQLAFKGITLADLGTTYVPSAKMSGGWVTADGLPVSFSVRTVADGVVRYQAQAVEGSVKAVAIEFTDGEGGVYVRANVDEGFYNSDLTKFGSDIYISSSTFAGAIATSADSDTYGIHDLGLVSVDDLDAICLNFNDSNDSMVKTYEPVGPDAYAVTGFMWSQMLGTNNNTMNGVRLIDSKTSATLDLPSVTVTVTGTRGTWSYAGYTAASDVRYGYIDENENYTTPTVTVSNVPFEFYKVVFIPSTDTGNSKFGYITVNGKNYSSDNTEKATDRDYDIVEDSTAAWGKTQNAAYLHGVNYLVTPVLAATSDGSVKVVGHKSNGRGCIAAIQIVKATVPEITSTDITAAQINAAIPSGESFLKVPAGATITLDEALTASKVRIASSGTITLAADEQPSAEHLAKIDVSAVKGAVLRSWLKPGVVGFNFNANGARNYAGGYGSEDAANDTSLSLEIGDWYKDASSREGSTTELFLDGLSTLTWWSNNLYCEVENPTDGTFIQGYLDDGGTGASIALSSVPYETYDLIIYCSTDSGNRKFSAKTVNGSYYTWDSAKGEVVEVDAITEDVAWGNSTLAAGKAVYGANTIRINNLSGALTINSRNVGGRGGIAAIQVMPAGTSTTPTMIVGAAGETTQAKWTDKLWNCTSAPTSGNVIIEVSGDVELSIDEPVSLAAITVVGEGSLTIMPDQAAGASLTASSISSPIPVAFANDGVGIEIISAPITYIYSVTLIVSSSFGNTYTAGAGTAESAVAITHSGGSATLMGGTYYLAESTSGTATTVSFSDATAIYSDRLGLGMATYIVEGSSSITTPRVILSQENAGRTANMVLKDDASITVTGGADGDTNQGNMFGHWNGPSTFTIQDNATFISAAHEVLVGRTGNNHTINLNGGVFKAKGLTASGNASGANNIYMNGGVLALGSVGIMSYGSSRTITTTVNSDSTIMAYEATLVLAQPIVLSDGATLVVTGEEGLEDFAINVSGIVSGAGTLRKTGAGKLTLSTSAMATGTLAVDEGAVELAAGVSWAGTVVLGENGTLNIVLDADTLAETPYIDICGSLDASVGTITINGYAIGDIGWTLRGTRVVNQSLTGVMRTATEGFMFGSAGWVDATGEAMTVDWGSSIAEVRVKAENEQPAYAGVDVNAAQVKKFAVDGAGDLTFYSSGEGAISAETFDFTGTTGAIDYQLSTGDSPVASGADTRLSGGGSGDVAVASGNTATLGPWGTTEDGVTYSYSGMFKPAAGATMVFNPGEGNTQKVGGFGETSQSTTIAVTNGTLVVDKAGGGESVFFGANSVRIDDGGIVSLEAQDALGYGNARTVTINRGGVLSVKVRDTLKRTVALNGGTIEVQGENSGRALDFFNGNIITVTDNSLVQGIATEDESNPKIYFRDDSDNQSNTITVNIDDGISMVNNVTYAYSGKVTVRGTMNNGVGNGSMVMNGFNNNPLTFTGLATIGESGKPVMYKLNCEHQNGIYTVNAASRFMGSGSVTGNGGVTLAAANSKICGSLTINNVTATSGGTFGDQWNSVAAKIADSFTASGTQTIENGSLTLLDTCTVTNSAGVANATDASFNIMSNGRLVLATSLEVGGLTVADGGTIVLAASKNAAKSAKLTVKEGEPSYAGKVNVVLDFGDEGVPGNFKVALPPGLTAENASVTDLNGRKRWRIEDGYAVSNGGLYFIIR